jgi:hypothetical protein
LVRRSDLPRDRLLSRGASALSNTELLAALFGCDPERIRADVCAAGGLAGYMIRHDADCRWHDKHVCVRRRNLRDA